MRVLLLLCLFISTKADKTTTSDLLWPQPSSMKFGSNVYSIDKSFVFLADGEGAMSDILSSAFGRYQKHIFDDPTPFYPLGAGVAPERMLGNLTVTVTSADESLNLKTDESCETLGLIVLHKLSILRSYFFLDTLSVIDGKGSLAAQTVFGALRGLCMQHFSKYLMIHFFLF